MARNRLTMLDVDEVSGVDKAANAKKFLILKSAPKDDMPEAIQRSGDEKSSALGWVLGALKKAVGIAGPTTEDEMTAEEIQKAVTDALVEGLTPITKRLDDLEAAEVKEVVKEVVKEEVEEVVKEAAVTLEDITKSVQEAITSALVPLEARLVVIEGAQGQRQSKATEAASQTVKKSVWTGLI